MKISEIIKRVKSHPGSRVSLPRLAWQMMPYYLSRKGFSFKPLTIYLAVNSVCNMKCKMCDFGQQKVGNIFYNNLKTSELSLAKLKELIDEVKHFNPLIAINAAEPLLYKDIRELCKYIVDSGLEVQITTNGYLLENFAQDFVNIGVQRIWVSLDGPADVHGVIRGVDDCFLKATAGLKRIQELKKGKYPRLFTAFTVSDYNYSKISDFLESVKDIDFESIVVAHMNFITSEMARIHNEKYGSICKATVMSVEEVSPFKIDIDVLYKQLEAAKGKVHFLPELNYNQLNDFYNHPEIFIGSARCQVPWVAVQVLASGNLIPLSRCYNFDLGNINEEKFLNLWNGPKMRNLRKLLKKQGTFPACSRCCGIF
jgi:Fe-coproporphyrin III synthase